MWRIFIESGDWIIVLIWLFVGIVTITSIRECKKERKPETELCAILFGILFLVFSVVFCFAGHQYAKDYGREYTMIVDVYYPNNKVVRKTFNATNECIMIDYPYRSRMSTKIHTRTKSFLETTADVEVVSYTYRDKK